MNKLAIIGMGNIGSAVLEHLHAHPLPGLEVVAVCDLVKPSGKIARILKKSSIPFITRIDDIPAHRPDHVLEAATQEVVKECAVFFLERGISFITLSSGALADAGLRRRVMSLCAPEGPRVIIPSGAVGGLDIVKAAAAGNLTSVHLKTTKPAGTLVAPDGGSGTRPSGPTILYRGTAAEAAARYPRNVNVVMSLALAGIGPERTTVEIVADPAAVENVHEIIIEGDFGRASVTLRNRPSPANPKTSLLAILSVLATLKQLKSGLVAGM